MNREMEGALWTRLEELVIQWKALGDGEEAVRMKLNVELGQILTALYPMNSAAWAHFSDLWAAVVQSFDPSIGTLEHYWKFKLSKLESEARHEERGDHRRSVVQDGRKRNEWVSNVSLDRPIAGGGMYGDTYRDVLLDNSASGPEDRAELREKFVSLILLILELPTKLNGRANNPARVRYYRMFFTDEAVNLIAHGGGELLRRHERDLFRAMHLDFLDFFMAAPCRTVADIERTRLKLYGEMAPGRPMTEPDQPLPIDVYIQYLRREGVKLNSSATISNQRDAYKAFKRENLL